MDTLLQVVVSIGMYVIIFTVIGLVFYAVDKRVKAWLRRPPVCRTCRVEIAAEAAAAGRGLCAACARKRARPAHR